MWRRAFVVAIAVAVLGALPALAQEQVRVRAGSHVGFGRLVFDWPKPVKFVASTSGRNLIVRFGRPLKADFAPALRVLKAYLADANLSADGRIVTFALKGDFGIRSFTNGSSVVVDLRTDPGGGSDGTETLGLRVGEHPGFIRLVFDWRRPVEYRVVRDGARLRVQFDRRARIDLRSLRSRLPAALAEPSARVEGKGLVFTVGMPAQARYRHFRAGTKVVLDILTGRKGDERPPPPQVTPEKGVKTAAPALPQRVAQGARKPTASDTEGAAPTLRAAPRETGGPTRLVPKVVERAPSSKRPKTEPATGDGQGGRNGKREEGRKGAAEGGAQAAPTPTPASVPAKTARIEGGAGESEKTVKAPPPSQGNAAATGGAVSADGPGNAPQPVTLVFEWPEPVGAAVFRRGRYLWIVFDRRTPLNLAPMRQATRPLIARFEQLPIPTGTVLRLLPKQPGINPRVWLDKTNWMVELARREIRPTLPVGFEVLKTEKPRGARLLIKLLDAGKMMAVPDPAVGDTMQVVTSRTSDHGVGTRRVYPEFRILASAQGLALEPLSDELRLKPREGGKGLVLTALNGLHISAVSAESVLPTTVAPGRMILRPARWTRGGVADYYTARQALLRSVTEVPRDKRNKARLALAQFYFSHAMAAEGLAVTKVIELTNGEAATTPQFVALKGALLALAERPDEAQQALADSRLDEYQDVALWRAVAAYQKGDAETAGKLFRYGDAVLRGYPLHLRVRIANQRVALAIDESDFALAEEWLKILEADAAKMTRSERAGMLFNKGLLARRQRDLDGARVAWTEVLETGDAWNAARAEYALIDLDLQQETISVDEAIKRLDRLRFAWRGDALERTVLRRLGRLYLSKNEYREGLKALRAIVTYFPEEPEAREVAEEMTSIFKQLYLEGGADSLPPLTALALYDEFRELTPTGEEGNLMIQRLAERLVGVDLLDRASQVLRHQIKFRLRGVERARVGTKLALIRLLARDPKGALDALRDSFYPRLPPEIEDDRRRIRAKALFELNREEDAIALLAGDISREADLLRGDIYWRTGQWSEAARVLQRLAGDPPEPGQPMVEEQARFVLDWAVALRLSNDFEGLKELRDRYGEAMAASPFSDAFDFIASLPNEGPVDLAMISRQITEVDKFEAFLNNYRQRLLASGQASERTATPVTPQNGSAAPASATPSS